MKEVEGRRATYLADFDWRDRQERGDDNALSCSDLFLDVTSATEKRRIYQGSRSLPMSAPELASRPRSSRASLGISYSNQLRKRPSTAAAAGTKWPTTLAASPKENREATNDRAILVCSASATMGGRRPRPSRCARSTSPRGPLSHRGEKHPPLPEQRSSSALGAQCHPFSSPLDDLSVEGQAGDIFSLTDVTLCRLTKHCSLNVQLETVMFWPSS